MTLTETAIGFVVAFALSLFIEPILSSIRRKLIKNNYQDKPLPSPANYPEEQYQSEVVGRTPGGSWVGFFELVIFYASFVTESWPIAASYLAFKLASKWNSWSTTWDALKPKDRDSKKARLQTVRAHLARAALDHRLFIVGTSANIVAAILGFAVAKAIYPATGFSF